MLELQEWLQEQVAITDWQRIGGSAAGGIAGVVLLCLLGYLASLTWRGTKATGRGLLWIATYPWHKTPPSDLARALVAAVESPETVWLTNERVLMCPGNVEVHLTADGVNDAYAPKAAHLRAVSIAGEGAMSQLTEVELVRLVQAARNVALRLMTLEQVQKRGALLAKIQSGEKATYELHLDGAKKMQHSCTAKN